MNGGGSKLKHWLCLAAFALLAKPGLLQACSVCFGDKESPMGKGIVSGIWLLLLVVLGVLASIVCFFVFTFRRASRMSAELSSEEISNQKSIA